MTYCWGGSKLTFPFPVCVVRLGPKLEPEASEARWSILLVAFPLTVDLERGIVIGTDFEETANGAGFALGAE